MSHQGELKKIIETVSKIPKEKTPFGPERQRVAAAVYKNPEFLQYIADETDRLLQGMALENEDGLTVEKLGTKVLGARHEILALGKMYQHFIAAMHETDKETADDSEKNTLTT